MLPVPNLDDRMFEELVKDARKAIPKYMPEWTDENYHDPGITLIELLSWFTEMQSYYLNRITTKHELKFLKLIGIYPREARPAEACVTFQGASQAVIIPKGTKLQARELVFETDKRLICAPAKLEKILVRSESETNDYSTFNSNNGVAYLAFGQEPKQGHRLYLGFDQTLPSGEPLSFMINLYENYPIPKAPWNGDEQSFFPSAKVSWKYYGGEGHSASWQAVELLQDETVHLSHSGLLTLSIPQVMKATMIHPAHDKPRYWLCCTLEEEGYEVAPRIEEISINTIAVKQQETLSELHTFSSTGLPEQKFQIATYLANVGMVEVQVQGHDGDWRDWQAVEDLTSCTGSEPAYQLRYEQQTKTLSILFGDGEHGQIPQAGSNNIRVICYSKDFAQERLLGRSNGLPNQRFELFTTNLLAESFQIQVGIRRPSLQHEGEEAIVWQDWVRVRDFDRSRSFDRHYVLDLDKGELVFGNNEHGLIPEPFERDNIRIISCQLGGGEKGNVQKELISQIIEPSADLQHMRVSNHYPAQGGQDRETLAEAKLRAQRMIKKTERAITALDLEELVLTTPGLRVARVKAIPLYEVGLRDYPLNKAPAQVTVVVVPYSEAEKPMPSKGFLETVKRRLEQHRLITTEIHVVPPEYVKVTVHGVVVVEDYFKDDAQGIIAVLNNLLHPFHQGESEGWPFGRTVYKGDVFSAINQVKGVAFIQDLWLEVEGRGAKKELNGNITLPPHGLVYSGEHSIEIISKRDI